MLAETFVVILSQHMQIKPSCCMPQTDTLMYIIYFSIKLEKIV